MLSVEPESLAARVRSVPVNQAPAEKHPGSDAPRIKHFVLAVYKLLNGIE